MTKKKLMVAVAEIAENGEDVTLDQIVYFDFPPAPAGGEEKCRICLCHGVAQFAFPGEAESD